MAVSGAAGSPAPIRVLRAGIDSTLLGLGAASVEDLGPGCLFVPLDFSPLNWQSL